MSSTEEGSQENDGLRVPPGQNSNHPNSAPATPFPPPWSTPQFPYWRFPDHLSHYTGSFPQGPYPHGHPYTGTSQRPSSSAYVDPRSHGQYTYQQYPPPDPSFIIHDLRRVNYEQARELSIYNIQFDTMLQKLDKYNKTVVSQDAEIKVLQEEKIRLGELANEKCGAYLEFHRQTQKLVAGALPATEQHGDPTSPDSENILVNSKRFEGLEHQVNAMTRHLEQQQSATSNLSTAHVSNTAVMADIMRQQKTTTDNLTARHNALVNTLEETITQLRSEIAGDRQNMAHMHQQLKAQHNEIRNLESLSLSSDPACILKIRIRTLMDVVMKLLYEALTKKKADKYLYTVKSWWISALDPEYDPENPLDDVAVDQHRFQTCLDLLSKARLTSSTPYKKLIESGTLQFITQSHIELRQQANRRAHELLDMPEYRRVLEKARTADNKICSDSTFDSIFGLVDFVDEVQSMHRRRA